MVTFNFNKSRIKVKDNLLSLIFFYEKVKDKMRYMAMFLYFDDFSKIAAEIEVGTKAPEKSNISRALFLGLFFLFNAGFASQGFDGCWRYGVAAVLSAPGYKRCMSRCLSRLCRCVRLVKQDC